MPLAQPAQAILITHRRVSGAEGSQPRKRALEALRPVVEVPAGGAGEPSARDTSGRAKIITMAQKITRVIAIGASCLRAPIAPAK